MTANADSQKRRVVIVDDHPLVREWLAALINQQPDLKVCGEAGNAADGIKLIATANPQIAIVDISMEGGSGIELIKHITAPGSVVSDVAVIVLSMHDEVPYLERALRAGARGYVTKREATASVLQAIRCVLEGKLYLSNRWAAMKPEKFVIDAPDGMNSQIALLSNRELEVFQLLGTCSGTRQIAGELQISYRTVQSFSARIKTKLKLSTSNELLREAMRWHDSQQKK
jgi:DNA-binding NarL/FixJ family response regulator